MISGTRYRLTADINRQMRLARCVHQAHIQPRIVLQYGANAGQHGT